MTITKPQMATIAFLGLALAACSPSGPDSANCNDGKCDTPGTLSHEACEERAGGCDYDCEDCDCSGDPEAEEVYDECRLELAIASCELRLDEADSGEFGSPFTHDALRWSCADVEDVYPSGVADDRGQEYCEYFAIVQPPVTEDGTLPPAVDLGRLLNQAELFEGDPNTTDRELALDQTQKDWLENNPEANVGSCVFASWHSDVEGEFASCEQDSDGNITCPEFMIDGEPTGIPLTSEFAQMKVSFNSNFAAADLVHVCLGDITEGDESDPDDPLHNNFIRGCMKAFELFQTEWRKSDTSACVAAMRLNECGCGLDMDGDGVVDATDGAADVTTQEPNDTPESYTIINEFDEEEDVDVADATEEDITFGVPNYYRKLARLLVPRQTGEVQFRGFPLGSWPSSERAPRGCHFVEETGEDGQNLISCDLKAKHLSANNFAGAADPKEECRTRFGQQVVVHVPVPGSAIVCETPSEGQYADSCGALPWVDVY